MLAVIETHPIQYHAPVYRALQQAWHVPVTAIYGSDFSVSGYRDAEFGASFKWDSDLLSGYSSVFLARSTDGGADRAEHVTGRGLRAALAAVRPEAVMVVGYSPRFHRVGWREARRLGVPILFRGETSDVALTRSGVKSRLRDAALRLAYRTCARALYIGARSRAHFERLGVAADQLVFSPYCVDTTPFQGDEAARVAHRTSVRGNLGIADDALTLLFSGKLSRRKGVDLLVLAARALPASVRERTVIVFLGDGDEREALGRLAGQLPEVQVRFTGFQNQTRLSPYYHAADALVLPSRHSETWGLVVNEALYHGVPCVVSDRVGSAVDLVEPGLTGEICASDSVEALTEAMVRVLPLVGLERTRSACRSRVAGYSVDRAAEGIASAYHAVTSPRFVGV